MILRLVVPLVLLASAAMGQGVSPVLARAADGLPVVDTLSVVLPSLGCLLHGSARHLEELPSAQPWARPPALVVVDGLPGQPEGRRGALVRVTRNLLARQATQAMIVAQRAVPLTRDLAAPGPGDTTPFLLLLADEIPAEPPETCTPRGLR
ncbi:hypothetical protein [Plastoroseomonas arctica]|uniref:Uncharacterized protein n=1 Tax=Plastoroseomonas arctica TaxID=1509237 RepID=A0AAF1JY40_9PROT|nr:hypothetical protein [Plastoroseomonas arctica]MBR0656432.1 hypothetical protein [Plastoroseomonas arctica]